MTYRVPKRLLAQGLVSGLVLLWQRNWAETEWGNLKQDIYLHVRDGVLRLHPTHSGDTDARTEGPGPGFPPTLIDKSQAFFNNTTIDSITQCPALLRSWAALQSHRRIRNITIIIHNHNARGLIGSRTRDLDLYGRSA
jgi:hypothetical protein